MVPVIQQEINMFVDVVWNTHRIREQRNTFLPDGIPNHIYDFPDQYGLEDCGKLVMILWFSPTKGIAVVCLTVDKNTG